MQTPCHLHLAVVRHIIRYLRGSSGRGLFFPTGSSLLLIVMQIGPDVLILGGLSRVGACFLVIL
jgi:hypothetical protein